jgi:uncharacterized cupin superfamily protein
MKTNNNKSSIIRQGDVLMIPIKSIPKGKSQTKNVTLALGEVTGHHHTIFENAVGFADNVDMLCEYVQVKSGGADLTHQEHETITIQEGNYQVIRQTEYTPQELRNVRD